MMRQLKKWLKEQLQTIDWKLLVFLILLLNVKFFVKLIAIAFIYIARPNFAFRQGKRFSFPSLYIWLPAIAIFDLFLFKGFTNTHYLLAVTLSISIWIICALVSHQLQLASRINTPQVLHNTIRLFFILNIVVSVATILFIIWDAGTVNPYRYQGMYQKYFISTGDLIKGITFDTSVANAIINAAGVLYFLHKKQPALTLLCMATLLLTGSNFTNIILIAILLFVFIFHSSREQKSVIVICIMFLVVFMAKVSPQNDTYATKIVDKILGKKNAQQSALIAGTNTDSIITPEQANRNFAAHYLDSIRIVVASERKQQPITAPVLPVATTMVTSGRPVIAEPSIHSQPFQRRHDTTQMQLALQHFEKETNATDSSIAGYSSRLPGKAIAFIQTGKYLAQHPKAILTGTGAANFSSKVAFRTTALNINGNYPKRLAYINPAFRENHLSTYLNFFAKDVELHSVVNTPNSVYNQLAGEYGVAGIAAFLFGYLLFFGKHVRKYFFVLPLLLLLCGAFFMDYWFEQLSIVAIIELLLFATLQYKQEKTTVT